MWLLQRETNSDGRKGCYQHVAARKDLLLKHLLSYALGSFTQLLFAETLIRLTACWLVAEQGCVLVPESHPLFRNGQA